MLSTANAFLRHLHVELLRLTARWPDLVRADPADEEAHLALVHAHVERGDLRSALRQFEQLDQALQRELRMDVYRHVQGLHTRYFEDKQAGAILSVLNDDINQLERFVNSGISQMIQVVVGTLLSFAGAWGWPGVMQFVTTRIIDMPAATSTGTTSTGSSPAARAQAATDSTMRDHASPWARNQLSVFPSMAAFDVPMPTRIRKLASWRQ